MKPERDGHTWENGWEINILRQLVELGWGNKEIGIALKRSASSISSKITKLGIHRDEKVIRRLVERGLANARETLRDPERRKAKSEEESQDITVSCAEDGVMVLY